MAEIKTDEGSLYFYTHWTGHKLPQDAQEALSKARNRLDGDPYGTKIVLDHLINTAGARDNETGAGIMLVPNCEDEYNHDKPSVVIDLVNNEVSVHGRHET
jgi:hypothetical protein